MILTKTLRPANMEESRDIRTLLRNYNVHWKALYRDEGQWVIGFSKNSGHVDLENLQSCPAWHFVGSATCGSLILVWVRIPG